MLQSIRYSREIILLEFRQKQELQLSTGIRIRILIKIGSGSVL